MSAAANDHFPHPGVSHQPDHPANYGITQTTSPAVTASGSAVEQAHGAIVHAKNEFQKHINAVERDRHQYSPDGFHSHVAGFASTDAAKAVDAAVSQVQERVKTAADQVDRMRSDLSPQGDVGAEMRAGRQWSRTQRILDSTANAKLFGIAQKIVTGADRAELGVLLEELPPYFESRGQRSDWLDTAVGQVVPEYAAAQRQLSKAEQARTVVEYNAKALRRGFTEGRSPMVLADPSKYDPDR